VSGWVGGGQGSQPARYRWARAMIAGSLQPPWHSTATPLSYSPLPCPPFCLPIVPAGATEALQREYLNPPEATCKTRGVNEESTKIGFQEVSGHPHPRYSCLEFLCL
jgi:hypothetical protein